jgi:hypothetical protein
MQNFAFLAAAINRKDDADMLRSNRAEFGTEETLE